MTHAASAARKGVAGLSVLLTVATLADVAGDDRTRKRDFRDHLRYRTGRAAAAV
jgi:hypothetical protein